MKKILFLVGMLWAAAASAQFTSNQILTASQLSNQFALYAPLAGANFTGPATASGGLTVATSFNAPALVTTTDLAHQAANTVLANATAATASPTAFAMPTCNTASQALNYTPGTGIGCNTALTAANASELLGYTWASPGQIGSVTPNSGAFTALSSSGTYTATGQINSTNNTSSSSTSTGAIITSGGIGVAGAAYIGGVLNATGAATLHAVSATTLTTSSTITHTAQEVDKSYVYTSPANAATLVFPATAETVLIDPAGALTSLTVTLTACNAGADATIERFSTTQSLTGLTVNSASGAVADAPTSMTAGQGHAFLCEGARTAWYPLY